MGADGTVIKAGQPVMVDVNGNYTGYMTDMTRIYYTDSPRRRGRVVRAPCRPTYAASLPR